MPLYILDANVLIRAHREYYPPHRVPEFWDWLVYIGEQGLAKIPIECHEEIAEGNDWLSDWVKEKRQKDALILDEEVDPSFVAQVTDGGYAPDLTDDEVEKIGRDPFLVAYALAAPSRMVVTTEISRPSKKRANRKLPDVCGQFDVQSIHTFEMLDALKFHTGWERPVR
jgi:hypothetical protein